MNEIHSSTSKIIIADSVLLMPLLTHGVLLEKFKYVQLNNFENKLLQKTLKIIKAKTGGY